MSFKFKLGESVLNREHDQSSTTIDGQVAPKSLMLSTTKDVAPYFELYPEYYLNELFGKVEAVPQPSSYSCSLHSTEVINRTCIDGHCLKYYDKLTYLCTSDVGETCTVAIRSDLNKSILNTCIDKNLSREAI